MPPSTPTKLNGTNTKRSKHFGTNLAATHLRRYVHETFHAHLPEFRAVHAQSKAGCLPLWKRLAIFFKRQGTRFPLQRIDARWSQYTEPKPTHPGEFVLRSMGQWLRCYDRIKIGEPIGQVRIPYSAERTHFQWGDKSSG